MKFNALNVNPNAVLQSLDTTKYSEILFSENNKRFIQIMKASINTYQHLLQLERLHSLSGFPDHLFIQKDNVFICNEQLDAIKIIEEL